MRTILLATAAALALPAAASAQDAPVTGPFTGLRAEGLVGYDALTSGDDSDGVVYGGAVGYDIQSGNMILGIEGEATESSINGREGDVLVAGDTARVTMGRDLYVGGRVGVLAAPTTLVYGKLGYTNARVNTRYTAGTVTVRDKADADGFRLGAGLEHQVGPNVYLKGEYRYSNYKEIDDYDIDADRHQVVAGVGVRF